MKRNPLKLLWLLLGLLCLALGCVGVILPILPSVPFFLATVFCFAKSSKKLHSWFLGTKLYKKHLESFVQKRAMTLKTTDDCGDGDHRYGRGLYSYARRTRWTDLPGSGVAMPPAVFFPAGQDGKAGGRDG